MLTQEKMKYYGELISQGVTTAPTPEESADFELVKAMLLSSQVAANVAQPQPQHAQVLTPVSAPAMSPSMSPSMASAMAPAQAPQPAPMMAMPTAMTPANGNVFTMEDLTSASMTADVYLKVKYQQTFINQDVVNAPEIFVAIDLGKVIPKLSIKGGNPVQYASTVDGRTSTNGGSWMEAIADIQKLDPKAKPYPSADIPMIVASPIRNFQGQVVAEIGTILGHSLSTTNWKNWKSFYDSLDTKEGTVWAKVTREDINKNKQTWAVLKFEKVSQEKAAELQMNLDA